jgi:hypothetical protein
MPVERPLWVRIYTEFPHLPCPQCPKGILLALPGKELNYEPYPEIDDPDILSFNRFTLIAKCNNPKCAEVVCATGDVIYRGDIIVDVEAGTEQPAHHYYVRTMYPPAPMISIPADTPRSILPALNASFSHYWNDVDGSMGRLRAAVELFLDEFNVPRRNSKGKFISLFDRIDEFSHPHVQNDWLDALRYIGNLGTHSSVTDENLFNAMDMFEIVLHQAFGDDPKARAATLGKLLKAAG